MADPHTLSEMSRRSIIDHLTICKIGWAGRLNEDEFLSRLYDMTVIPSTDHRISTVAGDIRQHRVSFMDWEDDWVFFDSRFNLLHASDGEFLRFLCETIHPAVRPEDSEARELASAYNAILRNDGWCITEKTQMGGHIVYQATRLDGRVEVFREPTGWEKVDRQLQEAKFGLDTAVTEEQFQSVGLICREALISVAEAAFDPARHLPIDVVEPSKTDARRLLEALIESELSGGSNEEVRAYAKAALRLAIALQHRRTADFRMASMCCEATASVVNIIAIVSGRRG